jgi:hypothetical protein
MRGELSDILELGLRAYDARRAGFRDLSDILERLATVPPPEDVLALRPSVALQERVSELLRLNRERGLTQAEEQEWKRYEYVEHLVRMAKAQASLEMRGKPDP